MIDITGNTKVVGCIHPVVFIEESKILEDLKILVLGSCPVSPEMNPCDIHPCFDKLYNVTDKCSNCSRCMIMTI